MKIEIEFSETDRMTAKEYTDGCDCIIATALKNRGYNVISVLPDYVALDCGDFEILNRGGYPTHLGWPDYFRAGAWYDRSVVGRKITLVSLDNDDKKLEVNANGGGDHQGSAGGVATPRHLSSPELGSAPEAVQVPVATTSNP